MTVSPLDQPFHGRMQGTVPFLQIRTSETIEISAPPMAAFLRSSRVPFPTISSKWVPSLEQLRAIFDQGNLGLVLIGMPGLEKRLARYAQFHSRIGFVHEFRRLSSAEVRQLMAQGWKPAGVTFPTISTLSFRTYHRGSLQLFASSKDGSTISFPQIFFPARFGRLLKISFLS
jgi:hypothetical protein